MSLSATADPPFQNLSRHARKLMDQLQKGYYNFAPNETWTPSVNLYETHAAYHVCVDLAGVEKEKIDLVVIDGRLRLRGSRPVPMCEPQNSDEPEPEGKKPRVHLMEIDNGSFSREVELPPDILPDKIHATYRNGLLWVEIPKV